MTERQEEIVRHKLTVWRNDAERGLVNHWESELVMVGSEAQLPKAVLSSPPRRPLATLITLQPCSVPSPAKPFFTVTSAVWEFLFPGHSPGLFFLSHHLTLSPMPISPKWKNTYTFLEDVLFICNPLGRQYSGSPIMISEHLLTEQHDGMNSSWQ